MLKYYALITVFFFSPMSIAENSSQHHDDHHDQSDQHSTSEQQAHLHGVAELTLAIEGNKLEISLESPAVNIVGFEHKATSKQQIKAVEQAKSILESSPRLFSFSGSDCVLQQASVDMSALIEQDHHDHHDDEHDDEHDDSHSEVSADYHYQCAQGEKLDSISVNLIALFPSFEKLKVMWLTDSQQGAAELTATSSLVRIR